VAKSYENVRAILANTATTRPWSGSQTLEIPKQRAVHAEGLRGDFAPAGAQKLKSNFELQVRFSHGEGLRQSGRAPQSVTRRTNPGSAGAALGGFFLASYPNGIGLRRAR
jgi:hypothetical protein